MIREEIEIAKTAGLWTLGIILFLMVMLYDHWRLSADDKAIQIINEQIRPYVVIVDSYVTTENLQLEIIRTQLSQLKPRR